MGKIVEYLGKGGCIYEGELVETEEGCFIGGQEVYEDEGIYRFFDDEEEET